MLKLIVATLMLACYASAQQFPINAAATLGGGFLGSDGKNPVIIFGDVKFSQMTSSSPVVVNVNVTFFPPTDLFIAPNYRLNINEFGISSVSSNPAETCETGGRIWNPQVAGASGVVGDLGVLAIRSNSGQIVTQVVARGLQLSGPQSILGRSVNLIVAHNQGVRRSPMSPFDGAKVACGTIGLRP